MNTLQEFRDFFAAIPEERWCTEVYEAGDKCCALGHLGNSVYVPCQKDTDAKRFAILMNLHFNTAVARINDGDDIRFQQPTPRQRILAAIDAAMEEEKR